MTASTIFVVDDDQSVRKGVARLLRSAGYQIETYPSAEEFMASPHGDGPGCLVLDIRMPGSTGLDLHERLLGSNSKLAVVFVTGYGDIPTSVRAIKNGAIDFLSKPFDGVNLLAAVAQALSKSKYDHAAQMEIDSINARLDALTPREREVLCLVVAGLLNKQIADQIGTTEKTVKVHRGRVMEKMRVRSLAELVQISARVGIQGAPANGPNAVSADPSSLRPLTTP